MLAEAFGLGHCTDPLSDFSLANECGAAWTGARRGSVAAVLRELRELPRAVWPRAVVYGAIAAVLIGIPSDLIDTPIFGRPIDALWLDWVILAITSALIGLIFAIRPPSAASSTEDAVERQGTTTLWGGLVSFLAVGCPVCNQAVVALVGISGALSWWAPVQPVVGLAAVALLVWTLRKRLRTYRAVACPLPA